MTKEHFDIRDSVRVYNETQRIKKILDAKYQKANLSGLVHNLKYLNKIKQAKLLIFYKNTKICSMEH